MAQEGSKRVSRSLEFMCARMGRPDSRPTKKLVASSAPSLSRPSVTIRPSSRVFFRATGFSSTDVKTRNRHRHEARKGSAT